MLIFHLHKIWFDKIKSGKKRIEYRIVKPYWIKRFNKVIQNEFSFLFEPNEMPDFSYRLQDKGSGFTGMSTPCIFECGYGGEQIKATITKLRVIDGKKSDLRIDELVFAIYFDLGVQYGLSGNEETTAARGKNFI